MTGTARILRADSRNLPLADNTVDLVVTSPPYFGLRSYQDGGQHYTEQIGAEATPQEFIDALLEVTRECVRVLKPSGSIFVNLGDKYGPDKSLMGIPWRYAIACIDQLGLILRAEIIWDKPNGLPESVTDRVRRSHEQWFHFTVQPRYYSAIDNIREPHVTDPRVLARLTSISSDPDGHNTRNREGEGRHKMGTEHPLGKLPGSVWTIPTQPLKVPAELGIDHFAAFPMEWPRRIIRAFAPAGVCSACGEGRRPIVATGEYRQAGHGGSYAATEYGAGRHGTAASSLRTVADRTITGERCACPDTTAPTTPGVVLDPFGGTGTTALVAKALGYDGISVDMSADYCRLAQWRTNDPAQLAKAAQIKPPYKRPKPKPKPAPAASPGNGQMPGQTEIPTA